MLFDVLQDVSWLAIVIGTIGYQVLGAVWYGPLFGSTWVKAMGYENTEDIHKSENPTTGYILTTIGSLIAVIALGILLAWVDASAWSEGLIVGLLIGIGFVATTGLQAVPFENRPWTIYFLNAGYNVVALAGAGALLIIL